MAPDPLQMDEARPFPFPALAACAAAAPLGGPREAGLAVLMVCRVAAEGGPSAGLLDPEARRERATLARQWLGTLALPLPVRSAAARALDAAAQLDAAPLASGAESAAAALGAGILQLLSAASGHLDDPARGEVRRLVMRITG